MGGGAGIEFEIHMGCGGGFLNRSKITKIDWKIESFDAHGYMDGWSNIDGRFLKVTHVGIGLHPEDFTWVRDNYNLGNGTYINMSATGGSREHPKFTIFSGYMRGPYDSWFPTTASGYAYLDYFGETSFTVCLQPARGFQGMYKDVFDNWAYHSSRWTGRKWEKR